MTRFSCHAGTTIADIELIRGGTPLTRFEVILISLFVGAVMLVGICQAIVGTWIKRTGGRNWPTVSAVTDIVTVADVTDDPRLPSYLATLTHVYNIPEQQMGDHSRRFGKKDDIHSSFVKRTPTISSPEDAIQASDQSWFSISIGETDQRPP